MRLMHEAEDRRFHDGDASSGGSRRGVSDMRLGNTYLLPEQPIETVEDYVAAGGGAGLDAARSLGPAAVVEELTASGLRGRGGAGFPAGVKWGSVRTAGGGRHYAVANGAEGEPATFKDRTLMRRDPYRVIEGLAIAAFTVGAEEAFCATKRKYAREVSALAARGARDGRDRDARRLEGLDRRRTRRVPLRRGEGAPRGDRGARSAADAASALPAGLVRHGAARVGGRRQRGTRRPEQPDPRQQRRDARHGGAHPREGRDRGFDRWARRALPARSSSRSSAMSCAARVLEVELGTPLSARARRVRWPASRGAGSSPRSRACRTRCWPPAGFDTPLTYEDMEAIGTGLGAAGFVVYDDAADMASVARELSRFLAVESCGQCPACKTGSLEITDRLLAIEEGVGTDEDLAEINARLRTVTDANRCYLGTEEQNVVSSLLRAFPEAFAAADGGHRRTAEARARPARRGHPRRRHRRVRRAPRAQAARLDVRLAASASSSVMILSIP